MNNVKTLASIGLALAFAASASFAVPVDPDCTPEIAAKSAAVKSTVGVGGRYDAKEAAADSGQKAVGVEDKGPIEKSKGKNDPPSEKAEDVAKTS